MSAACSQLSAPLNARMMTSWTFIARSTAAAAKTMVTPFADHGCSLDRAKSGHFTCSRERTDHVLPTVQTWPLAVHRHLAYRHRSMAVGARVPDTGLTLRQYYIMVGLGAFVTTLAQPGVIGRLPLQLLLKNQLHFNAQTLPAFMVVATFAWNVKPLAGILSDAFPLFGTRRRHYMLLGAGMAALCWFLLGVVPKAHGPLLLAAFGVNASLVIASTAMGGLMVEAGRKHGHSRPVPPDPPGAPAAAAPGDR